MPNNIPWNPPFFCFASFVIFSLTPFINQLNSSSDWTIFVISFVSSLKIIYVISPDPNIFLWIVASVADAAAVIPNGIKTILANGLSQFAFKGNPVFSNVPKSLPRNPRFAEN